MAEGYRTFRVKDGRDQPGMERHNDVVSGDLIWNRWTCIGTDLEPGVYAVVPIEEIEEVEDVLHRLRR